MTLESADRIARRFSELGVGLAGGTFSIGVVMTTRAFTANSEAEYGSRSDDQPFVLLMLTLLALATFLLGIAFVRTWRSAARAAPAREG